MTKRLRIPSLTIDCVLSVTKHLRTHCPTIYGIEPVTKRLSIPLWRSTVSNR